MSKPARIPVLRPLLPSAAQILPYLQRIDNERIYSNFGPLVRELQQRLTAHLALRDGSLLCAGSGFAALVAAIIGAAGRASAERPLAILPSYTFVATAAAVEACGYTPLLVDIDPATWMLDPSSVLAEPMLDRVGLVVPVAAYGKGVELAPWHRFRAMSAIPVVIDAAAAFTVIEDAPLRYLGDIPVAISFHATKGFSTGEGGCVVTTDEAVMHGALRALNYGFFNERNCRSASINGKLSEYHAAVGLAELDNWPAKRRALHEVAARTAQGLALAGLADRFHAAPVVGASYSLFLCRDAGEAASLEAVLDAHAIEYRFWYGKGLHHQAWYAESPHTDLSATDLLAPRLIGLPMAPDLPAHAIERIATATAEACTKRASGNLAALPATR